MPLGLVTRIFAICCCASSLAAVLAGCQNFLPPGEGDSPLGPLSDSSRVPETDPPRDAAWADQSSVVQILQNGRIVENPAYPYRGNKYLFEFISGDNDLPWLRQYAINHKIFAGVNMSLEWKDREWDMIKAIIYYTSHTLPFSGVNTDPDNSLLFRARMILTTAMSHPEYYWGCGSISQTAVGLAQAHGIPARMINGRTLEDPCTGDYCCEMFSTRWNRWIFLMPHVYAWIEHDTDGPLGVA